MNVQLCIALLAAGALAELIMLRRPTPGQRLGAVAKVFGTAVAGAYLIPGDLAGPFLIGYVLAKTSDALAMGFALATDKLRIWISDYGEHV